MATEIIEIQERQTTRQERLLPKHKVTFEEFLDWLDEDTLAEWVEGEIIMASPASLPHQNIGSLLEKLLGIHVEVHDLGLVLRAPFVMKLADRPSGREPDLLFVQRDRLHLLKNTYLDGAADLVIEIISPESIGRDRGDKFVEYERAGVKEYWLIDPERKYAEFYELDESGRYRLAQIGNDRIYRSKVITGFWLCEDWLWQEPLPPVLDLLRQLKLI